MLNELSKNYLMELEKRMIELSNLTIEAPEKRSLVQNLFSRYTSELGDDLNKATNDEDIIKMFNHFINNILSILESLSNKESYKSMRRLILNEIHGCKNQIQLLFNQQLVKDTK